MNKPQIHRARAPFDPSQRTYEVSRERLEAYSKLTVEQRLKWVEESAAFLRLAKASCETNK